MSYFSYFKILIYILPRHACHHCRRHVLHNSIIVIDFLKFFTTPFREHFHTQSKSRFFEERNRSLHLMMCVLMQCDLLTQAIVKYFRVNQRAIKKFKWAIIEKIKALANLKINGINNNPIIVHNDESSNLRERFA